ncbi:MULTISPECIES: hypothetical protein [Streptomyces]|uniref:Uncharacterized protein n=3 Tax=Streptomyces diastaticus group TaxID=2849069 RepID=A0A8H9HHG7_9ACTN|nr:MULTISPECIES: hypothetical protein [Streptomyces]NEE60839.1 hypothetical protein [Streptomyces sp. SID8455]MBL3806434.1 hypothetical protein [Streptomyces sp. BRB081]MDQ0295234.1 hypothetical protein [Streptomyces sp. DSM 41037]PJM84718.1 hypothetical protein CH313_01605 [Streptomyces sp. TSRI0384-2]QNE81425.1 hypothetical protein F0345_10140 [Streptomyces rutgersensis]
MWGTPRNQTGPRFVQDSDEVVAALERAFADADEAERPGLERALAVARGARLSEHDLRARWLAQRLAAVGFTGDRDSVAAVRALRKAEPALSLVEAVALLRPRKTP